MASKLNLLYNTRVAKKSTETANITSVVARESNGNIQITFTVPFETIKKEEDKTLAEMAQDIEIPGFRKGKAPIEKVKEKVQQTKIIEHAIGHILPQALMDAIKDHKLELVIYPKFELVSADEGKAWQIRGVSCELPKVELGNYKKYVSGALRSGSIIVPGKGEPSKTPEQMRDEKEQTVIKSLIENVKLDIPQVLITDEADGRLSNLLERIEKLGLTLDSYLTSIGKTAEDLRADYAKQAKDAITLDLILSKVAESENIKAEEKDIEAAMNVSNSSKEQSFENPESRKRLIESILRRRRALDFLMGLS